MFDTEKLIHEVKIRNKLWNHNSNSNADKVARKKAWEEIGKVFHHNWDDFTPAVKRERVENLMRKWRNVRDYYIKEKKSKLSGVKKKKYNYYDSLSFLDIILKRKHRIIDDDEMVEVYLEETHSEQFDLDSRESSSAATSPILKQEKEEEMTSTSLLPFETHILPSDRPQEDENFKANKNFLLSLLPDLTSLNERQNMKFRLGVLNLLNDIKFEQK